MKTTIDVFICHVQLDMLRHQMYNLCARRWEEEEGCDLISLQSTSTGVDNREFQRSRRIQASELAISDIYVLCDDDNLLQPAPVIAPMLHLMSTYPDFGMISLLPSNATIHPWSPAPDPRYKRATYYPHIDDDVMEHRSVGGVRFIRKNINLDWPVMPLVGHGGYDDIHCEQFRKAGHRVGYARHIKQNHLGEGYSTIWEDHIYHGKEERHDTKTV